MKREPGSAAEPVAGLRWSVEQRLAFASARLFWEGAINRDDIVRRFGVSPNQATADLSRIRALYPKDVTYDVSRKAYVASPGFMPANMNSEALLREFNLVAEGHLGTDQTTLANLPTLALATSPVRSVNLRVLRTVIHAIRNREAISASYLSMQEPQASKRLLSPHALVFDGFRWHMRAHDAKDGLFKDFVIARLSSVEIHGITLAGPELDADWNSWVNLIIAPHPGFTPHQAKIIAADYGMDDGKLIIPTRYAMLFYARKRLGLIEGHQQRQPREQQIVLVEISERAAPDSLNTTGPRN